MQVRGSRGGGVTAHFTIAARCVKRSGDGDDDDDAVDLFCDDRVLGGAQRLLGRPSA